MPDLLIAFILGIIEGLTEFIPVSSTGHLIVAGHLLGFDDDRAATFEVVIQLGAILAIVFLYRKRLASMLSLQEGRGVQGRNGLFLLTLTTLPALVVGAAAHSLITQYLFSPAGVAIGWGVGGIGLLLVERYKPAVQTRTLEELRVRDAVLIGISQCLALWPGFSRAAATISSGMMLGIDRTTAAEYSFLAALPVIAAASAFELFAGRDQLTPGDITVFSTGFAVAFVASWFAVRFFLHLMKTNTLKPFGWYRIVLSTMVLVALVSV